MHMSGEPGASSLIAVVSSVFKGRSVISSYGMCVFIIIVVPPL